MSGASSLGSQVPEAVLHPDPNHQYWRGSQAERGKVFQMRVWEIAWKIFVLKGCKCCHFCCESNLSLKKKKVLLFYKEKENWVFFFLLLAVLRGSQLQLQVGFTSCGLWDKLDVWTNSRLITIPNAWPKISLSVSLKCSSGGCSVYSGWAWLRYPIGNDLINQTASLEPFLTMPPTTFIWLVVEVLNMWAVCTR